MQTLVWTIVIILAIEVLAKVICLAIGYFPPRGKVSCVMDIVLGVGLIVWGAILLHDA